MQCRIGCGACCIAPSISSALPFHPFGKPAAVRCLHLDNENKCSIFLQPSRPCVQWFSGDRGGCPWQHQRRGDGYFVGMGDVDGCHATFTDDE